jgi:hypothetical protein
METKMFEKIYDISVALGTESIDYPGDTPFSRQLLSAIEKGDPFDLSRLVMSAHSGTHIDAPAHFIRDGITADEALDKKCYEIFGDESLTCKKCCLAEKAITERIHILHHDGALKTRSGDLKDMQVSVCPIIDGNAVIGKEPLRRL